MARPDTWMPFYWGDFWRKTGHLSPAEGWAYINLIGAYWMNGAPLEANEERLQRLAKVTSLSEWERVRKAVLAFFDMTVIDGSYCYSHSRIDRELAAATKAYKSRCDHMAKVNEKRRSKQSLPPLTETVTVTETATAQQSLYSVTDTQPQPQSPIGDIQATPGADAPLKARIFGPCLEWLGKQTRQDPNKLRALVGKWCSKHGDGKTLEAISAAQTSAALDPIPYITRILDGGGRGGKSSGGTDWDGASADQVGEVVPDVRTAWDASRVIDGEFSPSAQHGAGERSRVPTGGSRSEAVDEGLRDAKRSPGSGSGGVPENAGASAGGPARPRGGEDHHDLEMGCEATASGGHSRDGAGRSRAPDTSGEQIENGRATGYAGPKAAIPSRSGDSQNIGCGAGRNSGAVSVAKPDFDALRDMPAFMRRTA